MTTRTEEPPLFASPTALRTAFEAGLERMLDQHDLLGVFVLVLANAGFDPLMSGRLREPLRRVFARWCERFEYDDAAVRSSAPDDVAVFRRLREIGLDALDGTRWRRAGHWQLQFNALRALRPRRMSDTRVTSLRRPFDDAGFHFNKPFLAREVLWEGEMLGVPVRLLYNKFPFAELHGLLVPRPLDCRPQYLDADSHALAWRVVEQFGGRLPGLGLGYNAYGAYASVNHLHFQCHMRSRGHYPIESRRWRHHGGVETYPLPVAFCADEQAAWARIAGLQGRQQAFNLLYRPGGVYVSPRANQGTYAHSPWTGGFAWAEMAGAVTVFDETDFATLGAADIEAEFARLRPSVQSAP